MIKSFKEFLVINEKRSNAELNNEKIPSTQELIAKYADVDGAGLSFQDVYKFGI
jgi:hypothetical protein